MTVIFLNGCAHWGSVNLFLEVIGELCDVHHPVASVQHRRCLYIVWRSREFYTTALMFQLELVPTATHVGPKTRLNRSSGQVWWLGLKCVSVPRTAWIVVHIHGIASYDLIISHCNHITVLLMIASENTHFIVFPINTVSAFILV